MSSAIRHLLTNGKAATYANYQAWKANNNNQDTGTVPSVKSFMDQHKIPPIHENDLTNNPFKDVIVLDNSGSTSDTLEGVPGGQTKWSIITEIARTLFAGLSPTKPDGLIHFVKLNPTAWDIAEGAEDGIWIPNTENGRAVLEHYMSQPPSGGTPMERRTKEILRKHNQDPDGLERSIHIRHITDGVNDATSVPPPGVSRTMAGVNEYCEFIEESVINNPSAVEKTAISHYLVIGKGVLSQKIEEAYARIDEKKSPIILDGKTVVPKIDVIRSQEQEAAKNPALKDKGTYVFRMLEGASNPQVDRVGEKGVKDATVRYQGQHVINTSDVEAAIAQANQGCCSIS